MAELLLDSAIRVWVFLPIVLITFLVGIIRHYIAMLMSSEKKVETQQIKDRWDMCFMLGCQMHAPSSLWCRYDHKCQNACQIYRPSWRIPVQFLKGASEVCVTWTKLGVFPHSSYGKCPIFRAWHVNLDNSHLSQAHLFFFMYLLDMWSITIMASVMCMNHS